MRRGGIGEQAVSLAQRASQPVRLLLRFVIGSKARYEAENATAMAATIRSLGRIGRRSDTKLAAKQKAVKATEAACTAVIAAICRSRRQVPAMLSHWLYDVATASTAAPHVTPAATIQRSPTSRRFRTEMSVSVAG
jgi:hypothetical protein